MAVRVKRWTREEYDGLIASGAFRPGVRFQLVKGEIVEMTPQSAAHAAALELTEEALRNAFGSAYRIRPQLPLALDPDSEPEPDLAVVYGSPRERWDKHPSSAVLIVEISDTTLEFDRTQKKTLYARNSIPEYWILNLQERVLEVYREPIAGQGTYGASLRINHEEAIAPLACPKNLIPIAEILR